jgi:hypothetical protein
MPVVMKDSRKFQIVRLKSMKRKAQTVRLATTATDMKRFNRPPRIASCDFSLIDDLGLGQSNFSI